MSQVIHSFYSFKIAVTKWGNKVNEIFEFFNLCFNF